MPCNRHSGNVGCLSPTLSPLYLPLHLSSPSPLAMASFLTYWPSPASQVKVRLHIIYPYLCLFFLSLSWKSFKVSSTDSPNYSTCWGENLHSNQFGCSALLSFLPQVEAQAPGIQAPELSFGSREQGNSSAHHFHGPVGPSTSEWFSQINQVT